MKRLVHAAMLAMVGLLAAVPGARAQTVLAAASLTDALNRLGHDWVAQGHPAPTLVYGSSGALARQIAQGAPADIFISADVKWADSLDHDNHLVPGSRTAPLGNALVLIASGAATTQLQPDITAETPIAQMLGSGRLAIGQPQGVPAGIYAKQALTALHQWDSLADHLAPAADVRSVLREVSTKEAPLGIVYATDAKAAKDVRVVGTFPEASHDPIIYPFALVRHDGTDPAAARALLAFLTGPHARDVYRSYGFTILN
ncbi:molybdate transport system substrate-binding protein [Endobacter medicaginis]|uniref:Molybdate ABC transporter substrate-binding protein n=1 Tax=Endobacter medicaginis TaxID=1181271 RepID=A0A839V2E7_9PROT|nr:molybdate ABC transporter substrate-binding protein [Endobacter medicaginis]MBB3175045.1 molybdate transport system substrate-binding protein [Endobacter medicaginis]MCX5476336.1 molybdate ABC transporter substrate-binding protein [Endobacter medicaginis]NVN31673.1 molybdate ABC transporter substrate-binding protein [Endobacter medicaginis]